MKLNTPEFRLSEQFCLTFVPLSIAVYRHVRFPYKIRDDMEMPALSIHRVGVGNSLVMGV